MVDDLHQEVVVSRPQLQRDLFLVCSCTTGSIVLELLMSVEPDFNAVVGAKGNGELCGHRRVNGAIEIPG